MTTPRRRALDVLMKHLLRAASPDGQGPRS